jgi:transcriptional regulator with GAF, ATPase, and Fis domain
MASEASMRATYEVQTESQYGSYIYLTELLESSQGDEEIRNDFVGVVGAGPALCGVLDQVRTVAAAHSTVSIDGETSIGKELIAISFASSGSWTRA